MTMVRSAGGFCPLRTGDVAPTFLGKQLLTHVQQLERDQGGGIKMHRRIGFAVLAVLALALAACTSSTHTAGTAATGSTKSTPKGTLTSSPPAGTTAACRQANSDFDAWVTADDTWTTADETAIGHWAD